MEKELELQQQVFGAIHSVSLSAIGNEFISNININNL